MLKLTWSSDAQVTFLMHQVKSARLQKYTRLRGLTKQIWWA